MKVIAGLGNPENKYNFTRHNFGFLALDFYAKVHHFEFKDESKFRCKLYIDRDRQVIFMKPQTYYNDVGHSFELIRNFYKLTPQDFLIICDDFNLNFGQLRFRERGSAGGNNGLKSTISSFHTEDFPRLRLGTGNDELRKRIGDVDFVLSKFTEQEHQKLPATLLEISKFIDQYI